MEKKIILDTDMGNDCDDTGALAILHRLADCKEAEILAVTHCGSEISGAVSVKAINKWYGRENIPVGRYDDAIFLEEETCKRYTVPIMESFLAENPMPVFENAVRVLRRTLAGNRDVTICVIGMLNNIAGLLRSKPDDISDLTGEELFRRSVRDIYVMGGNFKDTSYEEYNIRTDVESANFVAKHSPVPITYCGFELGEEIITGDSLEASPKENPVRVAYYTGATRYIERDEPYRPSWDPVTVYCAVKTENLFYKKSDCVSVSFDKNGKTIFEAGGKDFYLIEAADKTEIKNELNRYLR